MKKVNFITAIVLLCTTAIFAQKIHFQSKNLEASNQVEEFNGFGCSGENFSPQLSYQMHLNEELCHHDVRSRRCARKWFWHWVVFYNNVNELVKNAGNVSLNLAPKGAIQSITDYGIKGLEVLAHPEGHGY
jgi:phosphatidylethanolamine-binding protein (PEBP) family uncharacterized protein